MREIIYTIRALCSDCDFARKSDSYQVDHLNFDEVLRTCEAHLQQIGHKNIKFAGVIEEVPEVKA